MTSVVSSTKVFEMSNSTYSPVHSYWRQFITTFYASWILWLLVNQYTIAMFCMQNTSHHSFRHCHFKCFVCKIYRCLKICSFRSDLAIFWLMDKRTKDLLRQCQRTRRKLYNCHEGLRSTCGACLRLQPIGDCRLFHCPGGAQAVLSATCDTCVQKHVGFR